MTDEIKKNTLTHYLHDSLVYHMMQQKKKGNRGTCNEKNIKDFRDFEDPDHNHKKHECAKKVA